MSERNPIPACLSHLEALIQPKEKAKLVSVDLMPVRDILLDYGRSTIDLREAMARIVEWSTRRSAP